MKTILELKTEISENQKTMKESSISQRKYNSLSLKNQKLKEMILSLETFPKEDFLEYEKSKLLKIIHLKESQFDYWSKNVCAQEIDVKKRKAIFNKELGLTALKRQIKTMSYILQ